MTLPFTSINYVTSSEACFTHGVRHPCVAARATVRRKVSHMHKSTGPCVAVNFASSCQSAGAMCNSFSMNQALRLFAVCTCNLTHSAIEAFVRKMREVCVLSNFFHQPRTVPDSNCHCSVIRWNCVDCTQVAGISNCQVNATKPRSDLGSEKPFRFVIVKDTKHFFGVVRFEIESNHSSRQTN